MPGGYNCSCPDGMDGDGRKSGSGCTAHPKKQSAVMEEVALVDENRLKQFINEIVILSQINHRNVVKLFGCCLDAEFPLLIYEFISGGNLAERIHEKNKDLLFSWNIRLKIATEIASAVAYLHSAASIPIYYRDIKSSSILLDEKYTAKVSDFGISRLVENDKTHLTTSVQGTFGYFDPEYFQSYQFTEKSDVFSFGVVLLELLTVEKTISSSRSSEDRCLVTYFASSVREDHFFKILDPQIKQEGKTEELQAVANLAMRCLNTSGRERPTMMEVASELERLRRSDEPSVVPDNGQEVEIFINETLSL
ncbi:PREDICTED: wall-associated receptor kinase-like 1 [Nelumbo nucifera]|uniref:Wall-associated receptor kinase-like 1 n=1 Tax=Nelumbo nucifera TaxID=4432 RepID=A0A1U8BB18_NELNU|nr:PREDICTED: wall-associated receptor kinase-like 1 [Nelumbo nucifera]